MDRKLQKMVSRVAEEEEDAAQLVSRVSHSHHSHTSPVGVHRDVDFAISMSLHEYFIWTCASISGHLAAELTLGSVFYSTIGPCVAHAAV